MPRSFVSLVLVSLLVCGGAVADEPSAAHQEKEWNDIRAAAQKAAKAAIDSEIFSRGGDGSQGLDEFRKLMLEACRGPRYQITDPKVRAGVDAECAYWNRLPTAT
ncbi:MAG TPA: hypothetical protein VEN29_16605 [Casimicrobiaceae bacterium]|nr:hypothetical protein [Casimicrobiaceae bacterium]